MPSASAALLPCAAVVALVILVGFVILKHVHIEFLAAAAVTLELIIHISLEYIAGLCIQRNAVGKACAA